MRTVLRIAGLFLPGPVVFVAAQVAGVWQTIVALGLLVLIVVLGALPVMAIGIRREERALSLASVPPGRAAAFTRRLLNVHVRTSPHPTNTSAPNRQVTR
ncbi:hypothetical protein [Planobispora takensis]|uniref:Uncharacterized protein n=1 Tax=Planobispora takensis TaxID=1367882 RepID=A0A8J3T8Y7_9ACTN|nr:hypothetical protein [Planobispora takensis]GII03094.1 hypothetical protein Pta02_51020 [Planobispora takensis]